MVLFPSQFLEACIHLRLELLCIDQSFLPAVGEVLALGDAHLSYDG